MLRSKEIDGNSTICFRNLCLQHYCCIPVLKKIKHSQNEPQCTSAALFLLQRIDFVYTTAFCGLFVARAGHSDGQSAGCTICSGIARQARFSVRGSAKEERGVLRPVFCLQRLILLLLRFKAFRFVFFFSSIFQRLFTFSFIE